MSNRLQLAPILSLLFVLLISLVSGFVQAKDGVTVEKSSPKVSVDKASSNNIHIDDIVIKLSSNTQSGKVTISEVEHKRIVSDISTDAQKNLLSWIDRQWWLTKLFGTAFLLATFGGIWAFVSRLVEKGIEKHVDKLDEKREEAVLATLKATIEIERAQEALKELQDIEKELNEKLKGFQYDIDKEAKKTTSIKIDIDSIVQNFESKITDEISELEQKKIKALRLIINEIDKKGKIRERIIENLILDLKEGEKEEKYRAADLLPQFALKSNQITDAFVEVLKAKPDTTLGTLLLNGLGELRGDGETLAYLLELVEDLSNPNILAIIGALGNFGETGKTKITDTELESIVDKLLFILKEGLKDKSLSIDTNKASNIKGTIALALSSYGDKAKKSVNDLITLLKDQEPETRKNAAIALGRIGGDAKDSIPELQRLKNDKYTEVREVASDTIEEIQSSE